MKFPFEELIPYRIAAIIVLAVFYGIYFAKMLVQRRHGIETRQIGRCKEKTLHAVELLMSIVHAVADHAYRHTAVLIFGNISQLVFRQAAGA